MQVIYELEEMQSIRRSLGHQSIGFVPTMGYLHEGHISLVRQARNENDIAIASIYVNPMQFGPAEDLSRYPRDLERDYSMLSTENTDYVFVPDNHMMYPPGFQSRVIVDGVSQPLEGERRPTHFEGVTTIVAKLFNIIQPTRSYFGQKDAQQAAVIRQMVRDLNFRTQMIVCPTVRESDGLAMSSRNKYLTPEQRSAAAILFRALRAAESLWLKGVADGLRLRAEMLRVLELEPLARTDYVSAADPKTLQEWNGQIPTGEGVLLSMAVFFDKTRLIDNFLLEG